LVVAEGREKEGRCFAKKAFVPAEGETTEAKVEGDTPFALHRKKNCLRTARGGKKSRPFERGIDLACLEENKEVQRSPSDRKPIGLAERRGGRALKAAKRIHAERKRPAQKKRDRHANDLDGVSRKGKGGEKRRGWFTIQGDRERENMVGAP